MMSQQAVRLALFNILLPKMQSLHDYQGFAVNLNDIAAVMYYLGADKQTLLRQTGFGDNKVRSLREYLRDFGLAKEDKSTLSEIGEIFKAEDKNLSENFAKWICLYNWARIECNPVLYFLLNLARDGQDAEGMVNSFKMWAVDNKVQTDYKKDFASSLFNFSKRALVEPEAFQDLSVIDIRQNEVHRAQSYDVHTLLVGYVLYDNSNGRKSVSISQLMDEPGNIGRFFNYGQQEINKRLDDLENLGLVQRIQNANLNMVQLSYEGRTIDFIKRYYAEN
jgi:Protein of unknown function (DUF4007)